MTCCFAKNTMFRMFDGTVKPIQDIKQGEQLMGDDNSPRRVDQVTLKKCKAVRVKYQSYLDSGFDKDLICAQHTVIPVIPEGNKLNSQVIYADEQKKYTISFLEAVINNDNQIIDVTFQKKQFNTPDEALTFTDKSIPNFLYQTCLSNILKCDKQIQDYFMLIRPLLPCRYTAAQTAIQNKTKQFFEQAKDLGLKTMDLPWITGLFLSCGKFSDNKLIYNVKELHKDVQREVRRIFTALKDQVDYDQETGTITITVQDNIFKNFIAAFGFTEAEGYKKTTLVDNIHLESFSKIRGPFLAGVMDGSADYGISDINYGLQCQIHGLPAGQTRNNIAELARSCSLATYEENDILIIAGGMLFRIQCVNNPPKDIPGLISLSSYPNEEGQNVLLGMPMRFQLEQLSDEIEMVELEVSGRLLLADYTVVNM